MRYTTIIFDLDGTLLDTLTDLANAVNYALDKHALPLRSMDEVRLFVGNGIRNLISRSVPDSTDAALQEKVFASFTTYYKKHCADYTQPYPGVTELLCELRALGCKTAIVSNKADFAVQQLAQQYFPGLLNAACGERAGIARKPAPDMLLYIMQELAADEASTVYVGDADTDLLTAKHAGVRGISVCWGFRGRDFLLEHGAEVLADNASDILKLCRKKTATVCNEKSWR